MPRQDRLADFSGEEAWAEAAAITKSLRPLLPDDVEICCEPVRDEVQTLFPFEHEIIARAVQKRRDEFSTGRHMARNLLEKIGAGRIEIPTNENRGPIWPDGVVGSITHSSGLCAVTLASSAKYLTIGLDIERIGAVTPDIMRSISHSAEVDTYAGAFSSEALRTALFSTREAVFKAYNPVTESYLGHKEVEVTMDGSAFSARLLDPKTPRILDADAIEGQVTDTPNMIVSIVLISK